MADANTRRHNATSTPNMLLRKPFQITNMNTGDAIIQAVIRAAAIDKAIPNKEGGMIFVWSANAAEQIEAAMRESGITLVPNNEVETLRANYHELILAVASKHEGEDRHATALRYIQERENHADSPSSLSTQNVSDQTRRAQD